MHFDLSAYKENKIGMCRCMYVCMYVIIHSSTVYNSKRLEQSKCSSIQDGSIKYGISIQWNTRQIQKRMRIQFGKIKKFWRWMVAIIAQ